MYSLHAYIKLTLYWHVLLRNTSNYTSQDNDMIAAGVALNFTRQAYLFLSNPRHSKMLTINMLITREFAIVQRSFVSAISLKRKFHTNKTNSSQKVKHPKQIHELNIYALI